MSGKRIAIAIDGPSGAGKSTTAKIVARKLKILYVDTGALYRTVGLYVRDQGVDMHDAEAVRNLLPQIRISVKYENGAQATYLNGENPGEKIREPDISMYASAVSAIPQVRAFLLETQKEIARHNSVVMDGRDIGTVILPDADLKVFLSAPDEVRAGRRCEELRAKGIQTSVEEVLADMRKRDADDSSRDVAPLKPADDAVLLDNSGMSADETADEIIRLMFWRYKKKRKFNFSYRIIRALLRGPVYLFNNIHVRGREYEPTADQGPYILACNHIFWCDPLILDAVTRWQEAHYMAKKELLAIPVFGRFLRSLGVFPIDRSGKDVDAIKRAILMVNTGTALGIFPQGHRNPGVDPRKTVIHNGVALIASRTHAPILPVGMRTKDMVHKTFRRTEVIFGKPIPWEELLEHGGREKDYNRMTEYIFSRICDLVESKDE
ncbi:MAG: (d)CMP kinase [Clostridia bacterium]|nr:(d)CMP kinase [Clostridia bacterium]